MNIFAKLQVNMFLLNTSKILNIILILDCEDSEIIHLW